MLDAGLKVDGMDSIPAISDVIHDLISYFFISLIWTPFHLMKYRLQIS